jgi:hypothetical protein
VQEKLQDMKAALTKIRCGEAATVDGYPCDDVEVYFLHLSLANIEDLAVRESLGRIPTGLTIPDEAVDQLVAAGESLVRNSPVLADFRRNLQQVAPVSEDGTTVTAAP